MTGPIIVRPPEYRTGTKRRASETSTERVILPQPGRALLHAVYAILRQHLPEEPGYVCFAIGGGTILAARWGHRDSKDLDVKVNSGAGHFLVSQAATNLAFRKVLNKQMKAAGAIRNNTNHLRHVTYVFKLPGVEYDPKDPPRLDLVEANVEKQTLLIRTLSESMEFWTSTNEDILAGKWSGRRIRTVPRDVFDYAVAAIMDIRALQGAISTDASRESIDETIRLLADRSDDLIERTARDVHGVADRFKYIHKDPARWAARAIGSVVPTEVSIEHSDDVWLVRAACEANTKGYLQGKFTDPMNATRRAAALAGLSATDRAALADDVSRHGGITLKGARTAMKEPCAPRMDVNADGSVTITDFGSETIRTPTIEEAVDHAIDAQWEREDTRHTLTEKMRAEQRQLIDRKVVPTAVPTDAQTKRRAAERAEEAERRYRSVQEENTSRGQKILREMLDAMDREQAKGQGQDPTC